MLAVTEIKGSMALLAERMESIHNNLTTKVSATHDTLSDRMANSYLLIEQKIDASNRDAMQSLRLVESLAHANAKRIEETEKRITNVATEHKENLKLLKDTAAEKTELETLDRERRSEVERLEKEVKALKEEVAAHAKYKTQAQVIQGLLALCLPILYFVIQARL